MDLVVKLAKLLGYKSLRVYSGTPTCVPNGIGCVFIRFCDPPVTSSCAARETHWWMISLLNLHGKYIINFIHLVHFRKYNKMPYSVDKLVKIVERLNKLESELVNNLLIVQETQRKIREIIVEEKSISVVG